MVLVWLVLGVMLVLFELHHLALFALFGAVGAFAAALVATAAPSAVGAQVGVGAGFSIVGVIAVRPFVSKAFARRRHGHVTKGVHGGLVGQEAITLDEVGDIHRVGHARLAGERWLAVSGVDGQIAAGTRVLVTGVDGTTLVVLPVALELDGAPEGADGKDSQ